MDHKKVVEFIKNSFLHNLLENENVTDISYNGDSIFYMDNQFGRNKSNIEISKENAKDFIRQISNLCEKQFSFQNPVLDVSVEKYRINAIHQSISKRNNDDAINFSIRIASETPRIYKGCNFFEKGIEELLSILINSHVSIVLGGVTGTGKTELQKYLITCMSEHTRIIVIDNILELDSISVSSPLDINVWQADERNPNSSIQLLVKNALRSNPDWLIVAESRGSEMVEVLNSSLTGHPIITTIHSYDMTSMPSRMARMAMMSNNLLDYQETLTDLCYHMKFYIYLKKAVLSDGSIFRYISNIGFFDNNKMENIYERNGSISKYHPLSNNARKYLKLFNVSDEFRKLFIEGKAWLFLLVL